MTTAAGEPRRDNRALMLAGHYGYLAIGTAIALGVAVDATGFSVTPLTWVADAGWLLFAAAFYLDFGYHTERLCERCIKATPLDAQATAERWRPVLRVHHAIKSRLLVLVILLAAAVWAASPGHAAGWADIINAVFLLAYGASLGSDFRHRKFYPWCPFCRWDDGGDHEPSPDIPAPAVSR